MIVEGAVYVVVFPEVVSVPTFGLIDHVTFWFELPFTVAVNCCDWLTMSVAEGGVTLTVTTFAPLPLPQPFSHSKQPADRQKPRIFRLLRNFVLTSSPTQNRRAPFALAIAFL